MPSPPPPPPPLNEWLLTKHGLGKPARDWLAALPEFTYLGPVNYFALSQTKTLVLHQWSGKMLNPRTNQMETIAFREVPDVLWQLSDRLLLLTKLMYFQNGQQLVLGVSVWNPWQSLGSPYEDATGRRYYQVANGLYFDVLAASGWYYMQLSPPPPPVAPPPAPAMGSTITALTTSDGTDIFGWAKFTANPNGTFSFRAEVTWYPIANTFLQFAFPVPHQVEGASFVVVGFTDAQAINGQVTIGLPPSAVGSLMSSAWTGGDNAATIIFEANNVSYP